MGILAREVTTLGARGFNLCYSHSSSLNKHVILFVVVVVYLDFPLTKGHPA